MYILKTIPVLETHKDRWILNQETFIPKRSKTDKTTNKNKPPPKKITQKNTSF